MSNERRRIKTRPFMSFFGKVGYPNDFSSLPIKDVSHGAQPRPTTEIGKVINSRNRNFKVLGRALSYNSRAYLKKILGDIFVLDYFSRARSMKIALQSYKSRYFSNFRRTYLENIVLTIYGTEVEIFFTKRDQAPERGFTKFCLINI